ncbi:hypothetical protein ACIBTV_27445 [Micromonospora sp. NPDC049366]|uniref:hypothetical protein n=1 Tax=Micromonospora sp. NPDC049366 TaxID=3364271 RepID=UPI00379AE8D1
MSSRMLGAVPAAPPAEPVFDHTLTITAADAMAVTHPDTCRGRHHLCPAGALLDAVAAAALPPGRYAVRVNDLGDRLLIGDRLQGDALNVGHADAMTLLYAAVIGDRGEMGALVRKLLLMHVSMPGTGRPWPDCSYCHGTGQAPVDPGDAPRHCHCLCDVCTCGEPLCAGPCETLAVMLDVLVLRGMPAEAVDVPRTLAQLQVAGVRRIVTNHTGRAGVIVDPVDGHPGSAQVTVCDNVAARRIEAALHAEGYRVEGRPVPGPVVAVRLTATPRA